jgi:hypothetical protein
MDRVQEAKRNREIVIWTIVGLLIAGVLLVITYLWLFNFLLK